MIRKQLMKLGAVATIAILCGCTATQVEREAPVPSVFVEFNKGSANFNNKYVFSELLQAELQQYEDKPVVVLVASGSTEEDYSLATQRLYSIIEALDEDVDYRVLVKPFVREEQRERMAVYIAPSWDLFSKSYMLTGDFSTVNGSNDIFRSSDERLYLVSTMSRKYIPLGDNTYEQLGDLLLHLGWGLEHVGPINIETTEKVAEVEFVTLEKIASGSEVELLLSELMSAAMPGYGFLVNKEDRVVRVFEKNIFGE